MWVSIFVSFSRLYSYLAESYRNDTSVMPVFSEVDASVARNYIAGYYVVDRKIQSRYRRQRVTAAGQTADSFRNLCHASGIGNKTAIRYQRVILIRENLGLLCMRAGIK